MPRARDPNRDRAYDIWKKSKGEKDLVEIASSLSISPGTVRGWKSKDKWDAKLNGTFQTKERSVPKHTERSKSKTKTKEPIISEDAELTAKQKLFCLYYLKCFNATKAYKKAYECSYETANVNGPRLLVNASVQQEINRLKEEQAHGVKLDIQYIIQKYIDIAFADITDFVRFGRRNVPVMTMYGPLKNDRGEVVTEEVNYVDVTESAEADGTIITEVKQGRDGISVKLADRMKALEKLEKYVDWMTEEDKLKLAKLRAEVKAAEGGGDEPADDGFLEALKGKVAEVWTDAEPDDEEA